ncbi:hypothetical protein [Quisquiliibacterium transsilvanicum]|jgi:hypothetical protein|uniref:Uncharacterized protein n=1 Tax=Quisquiliibacterium transsilvanicum TaxID=1549638 RepID=A0A7W8M8N3_9BURK|nr:hypothetical protein [Quisquiliibacterium transsilvanicum]MBB5271963.1 hypothetical protein [Quisquiliibacterium transsilvanicum]
MKRLAALLLPLALSGCAALAASVADAQADQALCERARTQARQGDLAGAEASISRMRDLREAWYCRNDLIEQDRGLYPRAT